MWPPGTLRYASPAASAGAAAAVAGATDLRAGALSPGLQETMLNAATPTVTWNLIIDMTRTVYGGMVNLSDPGIRLTTSASAESSTQQNTIQRFHSGRGGSRGRTGGHARRTPVSCKPWFGATNSLPSARGTG